MGLLHFVYGINYIVTFIVVMFVASPVFAAATDQFQYLPNESEWISAC